jgi:hypothetical protein
VDVRVLAWTSGPVADALAGVVPTVDAGTVNQWGPARLLARARLGPLARALKNRRLRSLLAGLDTVDGVLVLGTAALPALDWLPAGRRAVLVDAQDVATDPDLSRLGDGDAVATDAVAAEWLSASAVPADRRHVHGLLLDQEPEGDRPADRIGVVGWGPDDVGRLAAAVPTAELTWFVDPEAGWALWQGPTASPFASRVHAVPPRPAADELGRLAVLVEGRTDHHRLVAATALLGVPVVRTGPGGLEEAIGALARPTPRTAPLATTVTIGATADALVALFAQPA